MIPLKLQLKNFLSYGSHIQEIDFEPYNLICLSGKNGHGKSALLDAITWALWGQARKISGATKADEGLLRLGQTQMMVLLDFECNGQKYRVKREYYKTYGKPYVGLDFGMYNSENRLIPLSENKIRATQRKIENTIRLTLDTFVNSAFLRQGQANEFSKKSPKDRKEIFSQILGLQTYELVKKLAMDKAKQSIIEKDSLLQFQEKIAIELQKQQEINQNIDEINKNLSELLEKEKKEDISQKQLEQAIKSLSEKTHSYEILKFRCQHLIKDEKEMQKDLIDMRNKWKSIHRQKIQLSDQKSLEKGKKELIEKINKHQKILQEQLQIKEQYLKKKEQLQAVEKNFYDTFNKNLQNKKIEIEKLQINLSVEEKSYKELIAKQHEKTAEKKQTILDIQKAKDTIALHAINKKEIETEEKQFEKRKEYYQKYITQGNWIKRELDNLQQKQLLSQGEGNPSCPLCEQNLSAARKKFLKAKFAKQEKFLTHRITRLRKIIKNLKEKLIIQNETVQKLKTVVEKNKLLEIQIRESGKQITTIEQDLKKIDKKIEETKIKQKEIATSIGTAQKELSTLEQEGKKQLHQEIQYKKIVAKIKTDEKKLRSLQYNKQDHTVLLDQLTKIETQLSEYDKIRKEIDLQEERKKQILELCKELKHLKKDKAKLEDQLKQFANLDKQQQEIEYKKQNIAKSLHNIRKEKETLLQQKGALENQKNKLQQLEKEYQGQKNLVKGLDDEANDYKIIAAATGKDGIQALLIENAIPEVEQEANNILSRLTNNQAHIFIESLRDLKKGGTKETLDIKISDAAGIRPYELFSGGESFRIDFALRIAISKLLARRSGTALQTLIIDEGFGSQDEEGLSHIMDAIYKIQDDFSKVIIVSHLNTMKDQFPVHFFVQKGPNGSDVNIIEQG